MTEQATTAQEPKDSVTIATGVLVAIVRAAALSVEGVVKTTNPSSIERFFRRLSSDDGISIEVQDGRVSVEIHLVVEGMNSLHNTSERVQSEIARTINEYVGMSVSSVNVHIEDIQFGA